MKTNLEKSYGVWEVLQELPSRNGHRIIQCQCSKCGEIKEKFLSNLKKPERQDHKCNILPVILDGYQFGHLTVLHRDESMPSGHGCTIYHICQCDCPDRTIVSVCRTSLVSGKTKSCGSSYHRSQLKGEQISIVGKTFLDLLVLNATDKRASNGDIIYNCKCLNCGKENVFVNRSSLTSLKKKSCGCENKSAGELKIIELLIKNNYTFKEQYVFNDFPNRRFDFIVERGTEKILIEYDGQQHYNKNSLFYSDDGIKRDKEKDEYCKKKDIPLFRIPYTLSLSKLTVNDLFDEKYRVK